MGENWGYKVLNQFKDAEAAAAYYVASGEEVPEELNLLIEKLWAEIVRLKIQELV